MEKREIEPEQIIFIFMLALISVIVIACLAIRVYVMKTYWNTPIKDVPAWAVWVMQDGEN